VFIFNGEEVARMDFTIMIEYNLVTDNIGWNIAEPEAPGVEVVVNFVLEKHVQPEPAWKRPP
jgi:hypothetical protein